METRSNYVMVGAVTVALLVGTLLFIVWLAGLSGKSTKCYDIYFPAVGGIAKGSNVSFSGVPVGQVSKISLLPNRPEFVWVRIEVDQQTPVLQGTTAEIHSISLAGANEIQLNGAERGHPPITQVGPQGCPVVPASASGLSALLNSAPELLARIQRLTERLTELLSDKNQNAIADILENIDATTAVLRERAPEMADAIADVRIAARNAGIAANNIAALSANTNRLVTDQGRPAVENLNKAIVSARQAADNLNAMISDARPGVQNFSKSTLPEANRLVRDLRDLSQSLEQVSDRINRQGIGGALGPQKLPDYKPGKRQ
ncbi:MlaD family protein [Sphingomonas segetis]|jgi:phospholipid/cholesterol/gamma-HCH transport system substrate-binding protein|uniref:MlaD family protein n=1 Tax=Sphingomonas segetis TaxID=1104779 RepID=UPI0012D36B8B|nr:MlaD family protein [Sphingomonas segetis]